VVLDFAEKLYLAGFLVLLLFVNSFSAWAHRQRAANTGATSMEFLPLMATSVYCAIGLLWAYIRLIFIYLYEDISYQGQLSEIR
jgi:alpha-1,3-glucosyltransferase